MRIPNVLREIWTRAMLRGVHFRDRFHQLNSLYRLENPWDMDSNLEQRRFAKTNDIICREFGRLGTILEIGSGEGHQSLWLLRTCDHLHGRDVSRRAVARAEQRCPAATFTISELMAPFTGTVQPPFDLIVACEVLYYMRDVQRAVNHMSTLGKACLVSYVQAERERIESEASFPEQAANETVAYEGESWKVVWWRNN